MKISYFLNTYPIHPVVEDQIIELIKRGHDISVYSVFEPLIERNEIDDRIERRLVEVQKFDYRKIFFDSLLRRPLRLFRFIRTGRRYIGIIGSIRAFEMARRFKDDGIERIHCEFVSVNAQFAMVVSEELDIPFSCTAHAYDLYLHVNPQTNLKEIISKSSPFITISDYNRRYIRGHYGIQKPVEIVRCGIRTDRFIQDTPKRENIPPVILTVSGFRPVKALDVLARALVLLEESGIDFLARVIGGGEEGREGFLEIIKGAEISDKVELMGVRPRDEVFQLMAEADVFVLPSISEGIPVVIMEAMASGLPVVATDITGNPEIVVDGDTGFLVPVNDPESLAVSIKTLIEDKKMRVEMGKRGREKVILDYDIQKNVGLLEEIFERYRK